GMMTPSARGRRLKPSSARRGDWANRWRRQCSSALWKIYSAASTKSPRRSSARPAASAAATAAWARCCCWRCSRPDSKRCSAPRRRRSEIHKEGLVMPFTLEDFDRWYLKEHFAKLMPKEKRELLESLPPEQRLAGLSPEEIRRYLHRMT